MRDDGRSLLHKYRVQAFARTVGRFRRPVDARWRGSSSRPENPSRGWCDFRPDSALHVWALDASQQSLDYWDLWGSTRRDAEPTTCPGLAAPVGGREK